MSIIRNLTKKALYYGGYYDVLGRLNAPGENRLLIIFYHNLVEDKDFGGAWNRGCPSRGHFDAHVKFIKAHYRVISVEEAAKEIINKGRLEMPSVAITFDDGYASMYSIAFPVLRKHDVPATIYLPTDWINRKMIPWWITLKDLIRNIDFQKTGQRAAEDALGMSQTPVIDPELPQIRQRQILLSRAENFLRDLPDKVVRNSVNALKDLISKNDCFTPQDSDPLTWEQIREMAQAGVCFGAHTCSHLNLKHADLELSEREIAGSKREIEEKLNTKISGFAYPYGMDIDKYEKLKPILKKYDFDYATTASYGNNDNKSDLYMLYRTTLPITMSPALLGRSLKLDYWFNPR
jgi:peptidoglycan/xylan/chitin deacetylase (PgdA/CDA1 family)